MKNVIALLLSLVMAVGMIGCGSMEETSDNPAATEPAEESEAEPPAEEAADFNPADHTLVFSTVLMNHPVLRCVQLGFVEACEELGYNYQIVGTESSDENETVAAAEAAAAAGASGVILWAQTETMLPCIETMKNDSGVYTCVPHFQWEEGAAPGLDVNLACVCTDYAKAVADYIAERLEGKTGSIALTQAGYTTNEDAASAAFTARIKELQEEGKLEGITVLEPMVEGATDITESTDVNASIIQANPDLVGAVSWTGSGPVTWAKAARKCGLAAGDLVIVSMDYTADNLAELESGYVTALVAQPLYEEAYQAVYSFDALLRGETVPYWTALEAPLMYEGGEGVNSPEYYQNILDRVSSTFGG